MWTMVEIEFRRESIQMDAYILVEYSRVWMVVVFSGWGWSEVGGDGTDATTAAVAVGVRRGPTLACEVVEKATVECQDGGG